MRGSITDIIYESIRALPPGTLIFPEDYLHLGSSLAVNAAFSRLAKGKYMSRLSRGLYYIPKTDPLLGPILPSLDTIAHAVAERNFIRIRPTGAYALNKLGLSTQVPTRIVFLTNGQHRLIKVGKATIVFKPTTQKMMKVENELVYLAIQALQELGKEGVSEQVTQKLNGVLRQVGPEQLKKDIKLAPVWIQQILYTIMKKIQPDD